ncbi:DUF4230 domain-containing protein [Streptomyces pathocidini]|uniref:DUF4230 domain-containing protein n=1 Tax=Streptomyces pathocidini TaxID=1650571 RepID=A0ABW7UMZ9_9ACTN|nr:DUF4230 domain-containing protein [Streptomyces pathocidini]
MSAGKTVPWWAKAAGGAVLVAVALVAAVRLSLLPSLDDVLGEKERDRSGPALLESIQDISRYEAATGNFQVVVDLEKDTKYVPDSLRGTRTLYVGAGTVDAYVDMGGLAKEDVTVNEARTAASIKLPHAALGKPALDPDRSYTVSKQRGIFDRLGDFFSDNPNNEQAVQKLATKHIASAAKDSRLTTTAEQNTTRMLEGLLRSLGFTNIRVTYGA